MNNRISNEEKKKAEEAGIRFYSSQEEQRLAYLKEGLARTPSGRFQFLMHLMNMQWVMQKAKSK